jgi:2'-5' RNA ligase
VDPAPESPVDSGLEAQGRTIGVAVPVPEPYGSELQDWRRSFGDPLADAIPSHITLVPPTELKDGSIGHYEEILTHLRKVASSFPAFRVHLRGTATFMPVSPVVFVALAEGISGCERLSFAIRTGPLAVELSCTLAKKAYRLDRETEPRAAGRAVCARLTALRR